MSESSISIEALEELATREEATEQARRDKLRRMIAAYARILAVREPERFAARATIYADEDGHWDNSYPPAQKWKEHTGPRAIRLRKIDFTSRATSSGFYHDLRYYTTTCGLYVRRDGEIIAGTLSGTGHFGQYAAHPGEDNVECEIDYTVADEDDLDTVTLVEAEELLRELAFPLAVAAGA